MNFHTHAKSYYLEIGFFRTGKNFFGMNRVEIRHTVKSQMAFERNSVPWHIILLFTNVQKHFCLWFVRKKLFALKFKRNGPEVTIFWTSLKFAPKLQCNLKININQFNISYHNSSNRQRRWVDEMKAKSLNEKDLNRCLHAIRIWALFMNFILYCTLFEW